jgi:5-(carboxyamino)imidazole ribonucleotide mutase
MGHRDRSLDLVEAPEARSERDAPDRPQVGIVMGSRSDWPTLRAASEVLERLGVPHECRIVSAHRTPDRLFRYAELAARRGLRVLIAGAGGAAHLPGMLAAKTWLPVLGVPVPGRSLAGIDSLLSIVQMPRGVPVGTLAIGEPGAVNAALLAASMLAVDSVEVRDALLRLRHEQTTAVLVDPDPRVEPPAVDVPAPRAAAVEAVR